MSTREGYLSLSGGNVYYRVEGADRSADPLLVLSAALGGSFEYLNFFSELSKKRPVIFFDPIGWGRSSNPHDPKETITLSTMVCQVQELMDAMEIENVHLFAHGFSAAIAAIIAFDDQSRNVLSMTWASPILSASHWKRDQEILRKKLMKAENSAISHALLHMDFKNPDYLQALEAYDQRHCHSEKDRENIAVQTFVSGINPEVYQAIIGEHPFHFTGALVELDEYALPSRLSDLRVPTLITLGSEDFLRVDTAMRYAHNIPGAMVEIFPKVGYLHLLQKQAKYIDLLSYFLRFEAREAA